MQFLNSYVRFLGVCPSDEEDILKHIEKCGRICYKSEHKIDPMLSSHNKFFKMLHSKGHLSAIEHSNIVVRISFKDIATRCDDLVSVYYSLLTTLQYRTNYFRIVFDEIDNVSIMYISANIRAWDEYFRDSIEYENQFCLYETLALFLASKYPIIFSQLREYVKRRNNYFDGTIDDMDVASSMDIVSVEEQMGDSILIENDISQYTFHILTDRGISHEIVRHRVFAYSQESTRYINYKSAGIQFVDFPMPEEMAHRYLYFCEQAELLYNSMIESGVKPQFARNVLPHSIKTEITMTGRMSGYSHFINLRASNAAHPSIQLIARKIDEIFITVLGSEGE